MTLVSLVRTETLAGRLAAEIRAELGRRGQRQSALARALGETPMWVSERLTLRVKITVDDLARIADALGMTPVELLSAADRAHRSQHTGTEPYPYIPAARRPPGHGPPKTISRTAVSVSRL